MSIFHTLTIADIKHSVADLAISMRKRAKLSQSQLADELAVSRITIQNLEKGKNITLDTLLKVLQYFGSLEKYQRFIEGEIEDQQIKPLY